MAEQKKKRSFRKEYLNDFQKGMNGQYYYTGSFVTYDAKRGQWNRDILLLWLSCAVPAIFLIVVGCLPNSGLIGEPFALVPYALELIPLFVVIWKMVRMTYAGIKMRTYIFNSVVKQVPVFAVIAAVIAAVGIIGMVIALAFRSFSGGIHVVIMYIISQIILIGGGVLIRAVSKKMPWKNDDNS